MKKLTHLLNLKCLNLETDNSLLENEFSDLYTCDMLSVAMANAKENSIFITVINNLNTIGVASLLDLPCIILTEGVIPSKEMINKANEEEIAIFTTKEDTVSIIRKIDCLD